MSESEFDICTLGEATLNAQTNVLTIEVSRETGLDDETEPLGTAPMLTCLGVTALPAAPQKSGHAEGIVMSPCGPYVSAIIGANDTRCAEVYGQSKAGDTCLHNTGGEADTRARVFCKENLVAILVGNDTAVVIDRKTKAITINDASGNQFEMSDANGFYFGEKGGAWLTLKGGQVNLAGSGITIAGAANIGAAAAMPLAFATPLLTYLTALEAAVATVATQADAAGAAISTLISIPPTAASAMGAFTSAMAAVKALLPTLMTKAT